MVVPNDEEDIPRVNYGSLENDVLKKPGRGTTIGEHESLAGASTTLGPDATEEDFGGSAAFNFDEDEDKKVESNVLTNINSLSNNFTFVKTQAQNT